MPRKGSFVRCLGSVWLAYAIVTGSLPIGPSRQMFGQEATEVAAQLPTAAPYENLIPRNNSEDKWGYVRTEDDSAQFMEFATQNAGKTGVEQTAEPPKRWHIAPKFDDANLFQEGAASVKLGDLWGFIDAGGRFIAQPKYNEVSEFLGGYAAVRVGDRWGYINRRGEVVISPQYEDACLFTEGLAPVSKGGKYGYINTLGAFVITPQFDNAEMFAEGAAVVRHASKMTYIRRDGKPLTDLLFDRAETFRYGRAAVMSENRWGVLDSLGHLVVPFQFEEISSQYCEGLAAAKSNSKWGFIDLRGTWVIQPIYDKANNFAHGLAVVVLDNKLCIIDPLGNVKRSFASQAGAGTEKKTERSSCGGKESNK
jgi:hypothetical protein